MHRRAAVSQGFLLLLVSVLLGCGSPPPLPMTYPFVEVLLDPPPAASAQVQVSATFNGKTRSETFLENDMLNRITISLPPDGRGNLEMLITVRDANRCILSTGKTQLMVSANEVRTLTVTLQAQMPPLCPMGPPVAITVQKTGDGKGDIVATPDTLSCDPVCTMKMGSFEAGTVVTLAATPLPDSKGTTYTFDGWSGDCTGTGACFITLAQTANVTARFTCHGWCPENVPGVASNLNGLYGFASNRLIAVGDAGTMLQWNGSGWIRLSSVTPNNLRAISGVGGTFGFAVGDTGTILRTTDGGTGWAVLPPVTGVQLRAVWVASTTEAYAVGDPIGNNYPWLIYNGTTWGDPGQGGLDNAWHGVYGVAPGQYYVVGAAGRTAVSFPTLVLPTTVANTPELRAVFGQSHLTMTAVGANGTLVRYAPATRSWNDMTRPGTTQPNLRALHGTGPTRMVTVGENGTVWTYDGASWTVEQTPITTQLNAVYLISNEEIFVVGQSGLIYHKRP